MKGLLERAKEQHAQIDMIYLSEKGEFTHRTVIVNKISETHIRAFCFAKRQARSFKISNILSAAKPKRKERVKYAQ
jgi:predicted DNA-binding transcriptional regulator YafY